MIRSIMIGVCALGLLILSVEHGATQTVCCQYALGCVDPANADVCKSTGGKGVAGYCNFATGQCITAKKGECCQLREGCFAVGNANPAICTERGGKLVVGQCKKFRCQ